MNEPFTFDDVNPADATAFEDLPAGTYLCQIEECVSGESSKGTPQLRVQFRVQAGEHKDRVMSDWLYFNQNTQDVIATKLIAAGVKPPKGIKTADQAPARVSGLIYQRYVQIVVRPEEYPQGSGDWRMKVKAWKAVPESMQNAPTATAVGVASDVDDSIPFAYLDMFDALSL